MKIIIIIIIIILIAAVGIWFGLLHKSTEQTQTPEQLDILENFKSAKEQPANTDFPIDIPDEQIDESELNETTQVVNIKYEEPKTEEYETEDKEVRAEIAKSSNTVQEQPQEQPQEQSQEQSQAEPQEQPQAEPQPQKPSNQISILKKGTFNPNAEDSDRFHKGSGGVSLIEKNGKRFIIFEEDFTVTNGPDYRLYVVPQQGIETETAFNSVKNQSIMIGKVKQFSGTQIFELPDSFQTNQVAGVVIWCEAFSQFITTADLE